MANEILKFKQKLKSEAEEWVLNQLNSPENSEFSDLISVLRKEQNFDLLYDSAGENGFKSAFSEAKRVAIDSIYTFKGDPNMISAVAYRRFVAMMGWEEAPYRNGWINPDLMESAIETQKDDHRFSNSQYAYDDIEKYFMPYIFKWSPDHPRVRSFSDESMRVLFPKDAKVEPVESLKSVYDYGDYDELVGYLHGVTSGLDGRVSDKTYLRRKVTREEANARLVAKAIDFVSGEFVSANEIMLAIENGMAPKISLWDTKGFLKDLAPVVDDENLEKGRRTLENWVQSDLRDELNAELSKEELFNSFITNRLYEIESWQNAMNAYAAYTGERLTFTQARELNPSRGFSLTGTNAYMRKLDREFDSMGKAENYQKVIFEISREDDNTVCFSIESPALYNDAIGDELIDLLSDSVDWSSFSSSGGGDNVFAEIEFDDVEAGLRELKLLTPKVEAKFRELIKKEICPGDMIEICQSEHEETEDELGLSFGTKGVVTHVCELDRYVKVKGINQYIDFDNLKIHKKFEPKISLDTELSI